MLATQKGRSKPVRISCKRSEKVIEFSRSVWRGRPRPRHCEANRAFLTSSAANPATRMTFLLLVWPDAMFAPRCTQYGTEGLTNHYENVMIFFSESVEGVLPCLLATSRLLPVSVARAFQ